jgi:hypothetical protein
MLGYIILEIYKKNHLVNSTENNKFNCCSCTACVGSSARLDCLPPTPAQRQMKQLLKDAGIDQTTWSHQVLMHFCSCKFPATKQMLPKLLALLQRCHASGEMSNQWYFMQFAEGNPESLQDPGKLLVLW